MIISHHFSISKLLEVSPRIYLKTFIMLKVGQDRIEKILTSSQFQTLARGFSIDLKSIHFSSKQTESVAELNRKFLEQTAASNNQLDNNSDCEVRN